MVVFNHEQGLPGNSVRDIEQDSSGMMYFATTSGIAKFKEDTTQDILLEGVSFNKIFIDSKNSSFRISPGWTGGSFFFFTVIIPL